MTTSSTHTTGRALPGAIMVMWRARPAQPRRAPRHRSPDRRSSRCCAAMARWRQSRALGGFTTPRLVPHRLLTGAFDEQPEDTPVACGGGLAGGTGSAPAAAVDMHGTQLIGLRSSTAGRGVDRVAPWPGRRPVAGGGRVRAGFAPGGPLGSRRGGVGGLVALGGGRWRRTVRPVAATAASVLVVDVQAAMPGH